MFVELGLRLLYMDWDVIALRNVDHLQRAPAPSFVFYGLVNQINSGVALIDVPNQVIPLWSPSVDEALMTPSQLF